MYYDGNGGGDDTLLDPAPQEQQTHLISPSATLDALTVPVNTLYYYPTGTFHHVAPPHNHPEMNLYTYLHCRA